MKAALIFTSVAVLGFVVAANTTVAAADVITYRVSQALTTTNLNNVALTLPQFDPSLGTLDSVTLQAIGMLYAGAGIENQKNSSVTIYWRYTNTLNLTITDPAGATMLSVAQTTSNPNPLTSGHIGYTQINLAAFDGKVDFAGTSGQNWIDINQTYADTVAYTGSLSSFVGTGTLPYILNATAYVSSTTSNSGWTNEFFTYAGADLAITYDYTPAPVPEPATMSLLALGGLAVLLRRKSPIRRDVR